MKTLAKVLQSLYLFFFFSLCKKALDLLFCWVTKTANETRNLREDHCYLGYTDKSVKVSLLHICCSNVQDSETNKARKLWREQARIQN